MSSQSKSEAKEFKVFLRKKKKKILLGCKISKNMILIPHTVTFKTVLCQSRESPEEFELSLYFDINRKALFSPTQIHPYFTSVLHRAGSKRSRLPAF